MKNNKTLEQQIKIDSSVRSMDFNELMKKSFDQLALLWRDHNKVRTTINKGNMSARHIAGMFNLSSVQLNEWEKRGIVLGTRQSQNIQSWRRYSIKDAVCFAIVLSLRDLGIPLRMSKSIVKWINDDPDIVAKMIGEFLHGEFVVLYFNFERGLGNILLPNNEAVFLGDMKTTSTASIVLPMNLILKYILTESMTGLIGKLYTEWSKRSSRMNSS